MTVGMRPPFPHAEVNRMASGAGQRGVTQVPESRKPVPVADVLPGTNGVRALLNRWPDRTAPRSPGEVIPRLGLLLLVGVGVRARREGLAVGAAVLLTALMIQA